MSTPLGGYLAPGMEFRIDGRKPYKILFETCNAAGCHGGFGFVGRLRDQFAVGKHATFKIWTTKSRPIDVKVSLNGLEAAAKALEAALR